MLPERWAQVEKLYFSALEQDPEKRSRFLIAAVGDDGELLKEVLSLLNQPGTDSRLDRPVWDSAVEGNSDRLPAGTLLGCYEIQVPTSFKSTNWDPLMATTISSWNSFLVAPSLI
jgi:hypothetical protein